MRRIIAIVSLAAVISAAMAAGQDQANEGRAYLGFSFGGQTIAPRDFHYGLRLDYDARFGSEARYNDPALRPAAPLMQFDFTRRGLAAANLNGLSVLKKAYTLKQNEGAVPGTEAPPAEEPAPADAAPEAGADAPVAEAPAAPAEEGFFARSWHGVKNFFGGGDKKEDTAEAKAEQPAENSADVAQGTFMGYNVIDWATLAVGAVGIGFIASEVANGKESPDVKGGSTSGTTSGSTGCTTSRVTATCVTATTFAYTPNSWVTPFDEKGHDPDYQKWLDGGTGHMGDLGN